MTFKLAAVAIVALGAAALSSPAFAANDACTRLTPAEVGVALGTAAGAGEPITPTDHKVCTWKATDGHSWVTLMLQAPGAFDWARTWRTSPKTWCSRRWAASATTPITWP